jgi:hypothetical protein
MTDADPVCTCHSWDDAAWVHKRGCPVVQPIFDSMDAFARKHAEGHVRTGGFIATPSQRDIDRLTEEVQELRRRIEDLEAR